MSPVPQFNHSQLKRADHCMRQGGSNNVAAMHTGSLGGPQTPGSASAGLGLAPEAVHVLRLTEHTDMVTAAGPTADAEKSDALPRAGHSR